MKIFIICPMRGADETVTRRIREYVDTLEARGDQVHYPPRDTKQDESSLSVCLQNREAIKESDEVHVFYSAASQGVHFDLGIAFAAGRRIRVIENDEYGEGKSFPRMIDEWVDNPMPVFLRQKTVFAYEDS